MPKCSVYLSEGVRDFLTDFGGFEVSGLGFEVSGLLIGQIVLSSFGGGGMFTLSE